MNAVLSNGILLPRSHPIAAASIAGHPSLPMTALPPFLANIQRRLIPARGWTLRRLLPCLHPWLLHREDMMLNFLDIIAHCNTAEATNNGISRTIIKNAVLQFTPKPEYPSYISLHGLPPKWEINPDRKLISLLPPDCLPNKVSMSG
jgi:hypothetical protein